jgi:transposase-like protein
MCPECKSENTNWLRGAVLVDAYDCQDCGITFASYDNYTKRDVEELKSTYPEIRLSDKVPGTVIVFSRKG